MADQFIVANLTDIDRFIELLLLLSAEDTRGDQLVGNLCLQMLQFVAITFEKKTVSKMRVSCSRVCLCMCWVYVSVCLSVCLYLCVFDLLCVCLFLFVCLFVWVNRACLHVCCVFGCVLAPSFVYLVVCLRAFV